MPSLGDVFGLNAAKKVNDATQEAKGTLTSGRDAAIERIDGGKAGWWQPLEQNFHYGNTAINNGYDRANWGLDSAANVLKGAAGNQSGLIGSGFNTARGVNDSAAENRLTALGNNFGSAYNTQGQTGQNAIGTVNQANREAQRSLNTGAQGQLGELRTGAMGQLDELARGYNTAQSQTQGGYGNARDAINQQYGRAEDAIGAGTQNALSYLTPLQTAGTAANDLYFGALGARGADAQRTALESYQGANNPREELIKQTLARQFNARGLNGSGAHELAAARALTENQNTWINQLGQAAGQGGQYGVQAANFAQQGGRDLGNFAAQRGQAESGLYTGEAGALSPQSFQDGQLAGQVRGNLGTQAGSVLGNLGTQQAQRATNYGNNVGQMILGTGDDQARIAQELGLQQSNIIGQQGVANAANYTDEAIRQAQIQGNLGTSLATNEANKGQNLLQQALALMQQGNQRYGKEAEYNRQDDGSIANLLYGNAQQLAGLTTAGATAQNAGNQQAMGNIVNLATMAAQAAMGLPPMGSKSNANSYGYSLSSS